MAELMMTARPSAKITVFVGLTFALSTVFYYLIITTGSFPAAYALGSMWCPGAAAILTQLIFQRNLRGLGWNPGAGRYLAAAFALPLAYALGVYLVVWLTGFGRFDPDTLARALRADNIGGRTTYEILGRYLLVLLSEGLAVNCVAALGEEIGWRGLLVPELAKTLSFTKTALVSGAIWAVWHWPLILSGQYNGAGTPAWFGLTCFTIMIIGISFPLAWLRLRSGSLWGAVLLHAAHNLFIQALLTPLTRDSGLTEYVIDEFGVGLALAGLVLACLFWRRRSAVEAGRLARPPEPTPQLAPAG
jgi:membrane protease YdiL (CAAX protease family)